MIYGIYQNGKLINRIVASEDFCSKYCEENGYTYELIPEQEPNRDAEATFNLDEYLVDLDYRLSLLELGVN